jgi:hypothetical protein
MPQGVLPSKYEEEKSESSLTALAGLPLRLDLASVIGISDHIETHMHVRPARGWTDERVIITDDIRILEHDEGFSRIFRRRELRGFPGRAFIPLPNDHLAIWFQFWGRVGAKSLRWGNYGGQRRRGGGSGDIYNS